MLVECGFVRAQAADGTEYTFTPSLGRIGALGMPHEIITLFAGLYGATAARDAAYILASLCDQDDPTPLVGWMDETGRHVGLMPEAEQIIVAQHLMRHGIVGTATPGKKGEGNYSERFEAAEYIAAARVHLGLSSADAEALSMTEFQTMFAMKYPDAKKAEREIPSAEEYEAGMAQLLKDRRV